MSIVSGDLVFYNAASMSVDDTSTAGGAIDTLRRPDLTQMGSTDHVQVVSSSGSDTSQTCTITGRLADGSIASETLSLNGTTAVTSTNVYERLLKAELSATCAGTVTVRVQTGPVTIRVIPIGERGFQAIFQRCASDPSTGQVFYEKLFIKNTNGSLALTTAVVKENADPSGLVTFALAATLDDTVTIANRKAAPAGGLTFDNADKNVPNSQNLSSGSAIGVWLKLNLAAANAAVKTTWTGEIDGNTT